jgi:hypothetical protein
MIPDQRETLSEVLAKKAALQDQLAELEQAEHRIKYERAVARQTLLHEVVDRARVYLDSDELDVIHVHEGTDLPPECVFDPGPYVRNHEVAVQVYSARKRKYEVDIANKVNYRNPSHQYDEQVVVSFIIPREALEGTLDKLTELEKEA